MATNQVIHGSNRVVENPNRYKLNAVSGQANTYDLEKVPGVITDTGTPYSKAVLDKIDNVLSYLTPSVEKVPALVKGMPSYDLWTNNNLESTYSNMKVIVDSVYNSTKYASGIFYPNNDSPMWYSSTNGTNHSILIDLGKPVQISSIKHRIAGQSSIAVNGICKISLDNTDYSVLYTFTQESTITTHNFSTTNVRYIKYELTGTNGKYLYACGFDIPDNEYISTVGFSNSVTLDNNGNTFTNNQRVLVETPNTLNLIGVLSNTLNGIDISTILQPSTKYELIYNEDEDKFELGGAKTLFDITLTESVSEIDLTGITELLDTNKCYLLNIGGTSPTSTNIYIGNSETIYASLNTTYRSTSSIFTVEKWDGNINIKFARPSITTSINLDERIWSYGTINAGTRIIIKEVA